MRLGYAHDRWMFYSKAGVAFAHTNYTSNWIGNGAGGANLFAGTGDQTITYSSGTGEVHSLSSAETLQISGGTLKFDTASTASNITLQGSGTILGAGALTVTS